MFDWDICVSEEKRRNGKELAENQAQAAQRRPLLAAGGADRKLQAVGLFCLSGPLSLECPAKFLFGSRSRKEAHCQCL